MSKAKTKPRVVTKSRWLAANDAGPHYAVLPSGLDPDGDHSYVRLTVPDPAALIRSGKLPKELQEAAVVFANHPDGPDELMREVVVAAALRGAGQDALARLIASGEELGYHLIAEMLLEPEITVEEAKTLPEMDRRMLIDFAERRRNVDAAGNRLPIITIDDWLSFRARPDDDAGAGARGENGAEPAGDVSEPDGGDV